jgi:hypothetical protein
LLLKQKFDVMGMRFFHLPKGKQFNVPYRFYDPKKEERDKREARIKAEMGADKDNNVQEPEFGTNIKGSFSSGLKKNRFTRNERKKSNIRLLLIFVILALLVFLFFI